MLHPLPFELHIGRLVALLVALAFGGAAVGFLLDGAFGLAVVDAALAAVALRIAVRSFLPPVADRDPT